jgi:hypothetical protein
MKYRTALAVVMLVAAFGLPRAKDLMSKVAPPKPLVEEQQTLVIPESQVWNDLADWCEAGQVIDVDEARRIANSLKTLGRLSDTSRLDKYTTNSPVTAEFIATLRQ